MPEDAEIETSWSQETLRLLFVGLTVWILGSIATFALLSGAGVHAQLRSEGMRATTLMVGFALGALALLTYGTLRFVNQKVTVLALVAASCFFLLPPVLEVASRAQATLAPGLLAILLAHAAVTLVRAVRSGRRVDRVLVPEAALVLLGLGLVMADLAPSLTTAALQ